MYDSHSDEVNGSSMSNRYRLGIKIILNGYMKYTCSPRDLSIGGAVTPVFQEVDKSRKLARIFDPSLIPFLATTNVQMGFNYL